MQEQIPIDWEKDTRDKGDHLNYFGAKKVTAFLGKYLSDTGLVSNHKNDRDYEHWNTALADFNRIISASL